MGNEDLTIWDFKKEVLELAKGCVRMAESTAKRKGRAFFRKYSPLMYPTLSIKEAIEKDNVQMELKLETLLRGSISYEIDSCLKGVVLLKEIEQVEILDGGEKVYVVTKSGRTIIFGEKYRFLVDLF